MALCGIALFLMAVALLIGKRLKTINGKLKYAPKVPEPPVSEIDTAKIIDIPSTDFEEHTTHTPV